MNSFKEEILKSQFNKINIVSLKINYDNKMQFSKQHLPATMAETFSIMNHMFIIIIVTA